MSEFNTMRAISKNSSSSRAIPVSKMLEHTKNTNLKPIYFGSKKSGMQAGDELEGERLYTAEHPTETESKGQEPEVDLLVDAARYFDCKKINIPGIYSGSYIDKIDFFVFADRLTKENKELREALEIIISSPEWIKNYGGGEVDIKAKQALNQ